MRCGTLASFAVLAIGLVVTPALSAQTSGAPGGQRGGGRMQAMALQGITLTSAQQAEVDSIAAKTRAAMPAWTPGTPPSDTDRQKMRSLAMESLTQVRAVLTPDQQAVFDKNIAAMKERMQGMGGMSGGTPPTTPPTKP